MCVCDNYNVVLDIYTVYSTASLSRYTVSCSSTKSASSYLVALQSVLQNIAVVIVTVGCFALLHFLPDLSALLELNGPNDKFKELCKLFAKKWAKGSAPVVHSVLQVVNPSVEERFQAYIESLPRRHRKVEQYFHGTSLACNILEHLVICSEFSQSMDECGACDIIQSGFETRKIGNRWQRFGPGFYLSSKSSKAGDYCHGNSSSSAIFLCDVAPGRKYELRTNNPGLTAPPPEYHSVFGKSKFLGAIGDLNYDEIVLHRPEAIYPRYLFIVQS